MDPKPLRLISSLKAQISCNESGMSWNCPLPESSTLAWGPGSLLSRAQQVRPLRNGLGRSGLMPPANILRRGCPRPPSGLGASCLNLPPLRPAPAQAQIVHAGQACVVKEDNISERVYTIREGDTLMLQCLVTGHPRPQVSPSVASPPHSPPCPGIRAADEAAGARDQRQRKWASKHETEARVWEIAGK